MPFDLPEILLALQLSDSAFPSGAFTFSWGLEGLVADGLLETATDVAELIEEHLVFRWASTDRVLLARAYLAADDAALAATDELAELSTPSLALRDGTRRAGRRLLGVFAQLGHAGAARYQQSLRHLPAAGHLPVVQGLVFREAGLSLAGAELVSGWTSASGLVSAAIRLGVIGHLEAQAILGQQRARLARLLAVPVDPDATLSSFTPLLDIALANGGSRHVRLFAT